MSFYYEKVASADERISWDIPAFIDILEERGSRRKCLERIFTTGLTPHDYSRYGKSPYESHRSQMYPISDRSRVRKFVVISERVFLEAKKSAQIEKNIQLEVCCELAASRRVDV